MVESTFEKIINKAKSEGVTLHEKKSLDWFRLNASKIKTSQNAFMRENKESLVNSWTNLAIGKMYFFTYDPKHKDTLKYYDSFPLIIVLEKYKDRFLAVNLHFAPPLLRTKILSAFYDIASNDKFNETTKIKLTYELIVRMAKFKPLAPCIKMYIGKHVRSRFILVTPENWATAVFLPLASFEKASAKEIWIDGYRNKNGNKK